MAFFLLNLHSVLSKQANTPVICGMVIRHLILIPSVYDTVILCRGAGVIKVGLDSNSFSAGEGEDINFNTKQSEIKRQQLYFS